MKAPARMFKLSDWYGDDWDPKKPIDNGATRLVEIRGVLFHELFQFYYAVLSQLKPLAPIEPRLGRSQLVAQY